MPYHPQWHKPSPSPGDGIGLIISKQHLQQYSDEKSMSKHLILPDITEKGCTVLGLKKYRLGFRVVPLFFRGGFRAFGVELKVRGF